VIRAWRRRPSLQGIAETSVAGVAGEHDLHHGRRLRGFQVSPLRWHLFGDQGVQTGDAVHPLGQSSAYLHLAGVVDDLNVMMVLGPVISHE
jgi:hypothetical protein